MQFSSETSSKNNIANVDASMPGGVSSVSVKIIPPSYTHKPERSQQSMNLETEEGASVHWKISLQKPADEMKFIYNDSLVVKLKSDASKINWTTDRTIEHAGFYQLKIDNTLSELYRIEVKKDQPPLISIITPKPNTVIEYGEPERVNIQANVTDDYGVKDVAINATVAKGSGEAVNFKTQKISFGVPFTEQRLQYALQK
jgi:ribosomal protein S3